MRIRLTILLIACTLTAVAQPVFIAHRGASYLAPENTVTSTALAWEIGADAVLADVQLTIDNRVIVLHDKETKRVSAGGKNLSVKKTPSLVLRDVDVGSWKDKIYKGEKIPFLSEIIETIPEGKQLIINIISSIEIVPHLKRVIEKSGKQEQVVFSCFDWNTALKIRNEFPGNACFWKTSTQKGLRKKMADAAAARLAGISLSYKIIDESVMQLARESGLEIHAWTVNDPEIAKNLVKLGVNALITDRPGWLKNELKKP